MNVRTLCLGVLTFQEASGYEIKKLVQEEVFRHFIDASFGSIYPALTKMLNDGLVSVRAEEQAGKPDKKVYSITESGRKELASALAVDPAEDKFKSEFLFQIMLKKFLPDSHIADVYDAQIQYLRDELEHLENCALQIANQSPPKGSPVDLQESHRGMEFVSGYGRACLSAGLKYLEENRQAITEPTVTNLSVVAIKDASREAER